MAVFAQCNKLLIAVLLNFPFRDINSVVYMKSLIFTTTHLTSEIISI